MSSKNEAPRTLWVVTQWQFGGGGDDSTAVIGVFDSSDLADAAAAKYEDAEVETYTFNQIVDPS